MQSQTANISLGPVRNSTDHDDVVCCFLPRFLHCECTSENRTRPNGASGSLNFVALVSGAVSRWSLTQFLGNVVTSRLVNKSSKKKIRDYTYVASQNENIWERTRNTSFHWLKINFWPPSGYYEVAFTSIWSLLKYNFPRAEAINANFESNKKTTLVMNGSFFRSSFIVSKHTVLSRLIPH